MLVFAILFLLNSINRMSKIRLHIFGLPHTITTNKFSHCAFTGKILRFIPMMKSVGYEVYYYGNDLYNKESLTCADMNVNILDTDEMLRLKEEVYKQQNKSDIQNKLDDQLNNFLDFTDITSVLYTEFNDKLAKELHKYYRGPNTDIICLPFGRAHDRAIKDIPNKCIIETGIGYSSSFADIRVFESYAILHQTLARENKGLMNYWFVCPNYYNIKEFELSLKPNKNTVGFFGRVSDVKGCNIIVEIAKSMPNVLFILCGVGDYKKYITEKNIIYKEPIHGDGRSEYLGSLNALIAPSCYSEPFCGVSVEAQLCGTPVITNDFGALVETVEPMKTGVHCHTLADYIAGIRMALDDKFDREYIRMRAVQMYDMYNVAKKYDYIFKTVNDLYNGNNGWYSKQSYLELPTIK